MTKKTIEKSNDHRVRELSPKERRAVAGGPEEGTLKGTGNTPS